MLLGRTPWGKQLDDPRSIGQPLHGPVLGRFCYGVDIGRTAALRIEKCAKIKRAGRLLVPALFGQKDEIIVLVSALSFLGKPSQDGARPPSHGLRQCPHAPCCHALLPG